MAGEADYSINTGRIRTFTTVDYVLFSLVLVACALIGVFYAIKDRYRVNVGTFMLGGKTVGVFPVAMSLSVTFLSALTLLGSPVEVYNFNTMFWHICLAIILAVTAATVIFIPFFYRLRITTVCEYLQLRFNTAVRIVCTVLFIVQTLLYFSFVLYAPSLALSSVTHISLWGSVIGVGLVVTFYTTLGGMKAVVWTDTIQAAVILAGIIAILIRGSIVSGGFIPAWKVAKSRGRILFDDFSFDPSVRHSFWSVAVGGAFFWMSLYGVNQAQVQRCLSCATVKKAQWALMINLPVIFTISCLCFMTGVVMFAFYANCHPEGIISKRDQLLPLFAMDILGDYPGVPGIFVACIFSGSLSSLSSGLNAVTALTVKDLLLPYCLPRLSDFKVTLISKLIVIVYSVCAIGLAWLVGQLGSILQVSYSIYGILNGPIFGVFLLGMFFPWANSLGAMVGCFTSLGIMSWISIGAFVNKVSTATLSPVVTSGCAWNNVSTGVTADPSLLDTTVAPGPGADPSDITAYPIYTLSYMYYTVTGAFIVVIVGLISSFISGHRRPSTLDPILICPLFDTLFPCLPERVLKPLRCGVIHNRKYEKYEDEIAEIEADLAYQVKTIGGNIASPSMSTASGPTTSSVYESYSSPYEITGISNEGYYPTDNNNSVETDNTKL